MKNICSVLQFQILVCSVRNVAYDIDSFRHSAVLFANGTICIQMNNVTWAFCWAYWNSSNVFIADKYLINYLVVIVYPDTLFLNVVLVNNSLFSQSYCFPLNCKSSHLIEHLGWILIVQMKPVVQYDGYPCMWRILSTVALICQFLLRVEQAQL